MKFTKTLAAITAAAMAVSMAAIPASAEEKVLFTITGDNYILDVTKVLPEGRVVDEVYGATVTFAEAEKENLALGAGGGFIFSCGDKNWSQLQWCTGCEEEQHDIQYDAETNSVTRLDAEPVLITDTDGENAYYQFAMCTWWGDETGLDVVGFTLLDKDGKALEAVDLTPEEPEEPEEPDAPETEVPGESEEVPGESEDVPTDPEVPGETTDPEEPGEDPEEPGEDPEEPGEDPEEPGEEPEEPAKPAAPTKVEITNGGRTVIDSGLVRTNIFNEWTGNDADMIVDKTAFAGANLISVKFTVTGVTEAFDAWIDFADSTWAIQYWGEDADGNAGVTQTPVRIEKDGTYVLTAKLDAVIDAIAYMSIKTNLAAEGEVAPITITIDEIMINEEIKLPVDQPEDPEEPGETTEPEEPGEEPEEPGETTEPEEPGESTTPGESSGTPMNPGTGVALVVVPAALAAAALATSGIVLKKRSK